MKDVGAKPSDDEPDYDGLAAWVNGEMERQSLQPVDIARRGGPKWPTLDEITSAVRRPKRPATLRQLSEALGWPPDTAARILRRQPLDTSPGEDAWRQRVEDGLEKLTRQQEQMLREIEELMRKWNASGGR